MSARGGGGVTERLGEAHGHETVGSPVELRQPGSQH